MALERYHALLVQDWQQRDLWAGYVDSASAVKKLPAEPHKKLLLQLYDTVAANPPKDAVFLSRFGWALRRLEEPRKSVKLLEQSLALAGQDREIRMRLAEALQDAGEYAEAERHFQILLRPTSRR
jgi:tetratricopeptide (TPR) repeat protein